ncbi:MAG TPA: glycosyltransferase [Casimicrobiaceae bacterium]|nr:glycosyltransferase [Casimicrobiaceae bacterium]
MDHAFVVPAYGESPYLSECIASLKAQRGPRSTIVIATSTPSPAMERLARAEGLPLRVNPVRGGIGADWNFALHATDAPFVTIAHQDDLFRDDYVERMREAIAGAADVLIAFSDYEEVDPSGPRAMHANLRIKRFLTRRAFAGRSCIRRREDKRRLLAWGNPVCCPSVVVHRAALPAFRFDEHLRSNLDWEAWLRLADVAGSFVHVAQPLVIRRIHPASETTQLIADAGRVAEDRAMFERLWPAPVARLISAVYRASYLANRT